ncbi:MAG: Holliday junction resolvase RuvX, partial [Alphaproteobacteria bacterium]|nr:Holliday junction resolvase RuvX [Alphaproteobacteria bacterium]
MLYQDFKDFAANIPQTGRLLGIDFGTKRIGVAVSDESREFVFPRDIIPNAEFDIAGLIESEKIVGIVVGLPAHADGTDSETTKLVREFAGKLSVSVAVPVGFVDESLTSVAAEERQT